MRIQHNIAALNSHRQLTSNNSAVAKNLEKLSSGYKINRAGDDAAGLAISEKMRAQITGLETAQKNANDGISLVQTAEGALTEVHSMLNRMVELATQSANGTYDDTTDRANLQKELDSLTAEIDRISDGTNFNGINLLDGNLGGPKMSSTVGVKTVEGVAGAAGAAPTVKAPTAAAIAGTEGKIDSSAKIDIDLKSLTVTGDAAAAGEAKITIGDGNVTVAVATNANLDAAQFGGLLDGKAITVKGVDFTIKDNTDGTISLIADDKGALAKPADFTGITASIADNNKGGSITVTNGTIAAGDVTTTDGTDAAAATLKFDTAGMEITAPTDGSTGAKVKVTVGGQDIELEITGDMDDKAIAAAMVGKEITVDGKKFTGALDTAGGTGVTFTAEAGVTTQVGTLAGNIASSPTAGTIGGTTAVEGSATEVEMDFNGRTGADLIGGSAKIGNTTYSFVETAGDGPANTTEIVIAKNATPSDIAAAMQGAVTEAGFTVTNNGSKLTLTETAGAQNADGNDVYGGIAAPRVQFAGIGLTLQIGDTADTFNKLTVSVDSMSSSSLGIDSIDISTQAGAQSAIQKIKDAINTVSSTRGDLGAIQNRLEHTINNLSVTAENMTAAESRIRDVDMAQEMMNFTKNNILVQASQSMLAQANQLPQGVLQLLQ